MKKISLSIGVAYLISMSALVFLPSSALAIALPYWGPLVSCTGINCNICQLFSTGQMVIYFLMTLTLFVVGPIMVFWGGLMMLVSAGNEEKFSSGKKIATGAVVGILIGLLAFVIVNTLLKTITGTYFGALPGSGFTISCSANSPFVPLQNNGGQSGIPGAVNAICDSTGCHNADGQPSPGNGPQDTGSAANPGGNNGGMP